MITRTQVKDIVEWPSCFMIILSIIVTIIIVIIIDHHDHLDYPDHDDHYQVKDMAEWRPLRTSRRQPTSQKL